MGPNEGFELAVGLKETSSYTEGSSVDAHVPSITVSSFLTSQSLLISYGQKIASCECEEPLLGIENG